jgi:hypothetical protein
VPWGPFDWGGGTIERARRYGDWEESGGGDREQVSGGKGVGWGLTFDCEAVEPGVIGEISFDDGAAGEPECWWDTMRGGDRSRG